VSDPGADRRALRIAIFAISLAAILLEIALTRVFSFKIYYYFTFLILGLAMLGLGTGGVLVAVSSTLRARSARRLVAAGGGLGAVAIPLLYSLGAATQVNVSQLGREPSEFLVLAGVVATVFAPFLLLGVLVSSIFADRPDDMGTLYFADLVGAAGGCVLAIPLFLAITPPGTVLVAAALLAGAAAAAATGARARAAAVAGALLLAGAAAVAERVLPEPVADDHKTMSPRGRDGAEHVFSAWSSVFRVDVLEEETLEGALTLHHDGNIGSSLRGWDGDPASLGRFDTNLRSKPFQVLKQAPRVLIIGAAGGQELQASVYFGASQVTGVELNPVTVSLLTEHFADYTGNVAQRPEVRLVNAEGRSFLEQSDDQWDLIWMVAPDSYAAQSAGSAAGYVLTESYLYTVEMLETALQRLAPGGVLCAQFGEAELHRAPNRTPRFLATARRAMANLGVERFEDHVILSYAKDFLSASTTLLSMQPFADVRVHRYYRNLGRIEEAGLWHPTNRPPLVPNPMQQVITLDEAGLADFRDLYRFEIGPVHDDSPFFWHFTPFWDAFTFAIRESDERADFEVATGERTLLWMLIVAVAFAALFLSLPLLRIRHEFREIPHKGAAAVYFAALGLGFMYLEVAWMQRLTLLLGYPTYSLTVTLFALLLFSGLGSLLSNRYPPQPRRVLPLLLGALVASVALAQGLFAAAGPALLGAPLALRVAVVVVGMAPLGLCLGAFVPVGIRWLSARSPHPQATTAWAWSVNGFFSVVASVSATMWAMTVGLQALLWIGVAIYALGVGAVWYAAREG